MKVSPAWKKAHPPTIEQKVKKIAATARVRSTGIKRRSPTERVDQTLIEALEGDGSDFDHLVARLNEHERRMFDELVSSLRSSDGFDLDDLWKVDYVKRPPTMEEFLSDDYWMGGVLRTTEDNPGLFPYWREALVRDFDLDSRIHNVVITGSLGIGKTYVMCILLLYRVVMARLLRNPQNFFGLSKGSKIYYVVLSLTKGVVAETAFADLQNFMSNCPFFVEECRFDPDLKYSDFRIRLGKDIYLTAGSKGWHIIGRNTLGVCLDEGNWRLETNPDLRAYQLYDEVRTRIKNRFMKMAGFLPAISILSSSAKDESSFTEQVMRDITRKNDPSTEIIYRGAAYKIKRHELRGIDEERWFRVCYGIKNQDPFILDGWFRETTPKSGKYEPLPPAEGHTVEEPPRASQIEFVPERYFEDFRRNTRANLQSVAGISTGGSHRLFSSTVQLEQAIELCEKSDLNPGGVVNPVIKGVDFLPISEEDDQEVWDYLEHRTFLTKRESQVIPLRSPSALRFAHIDFATQTMAGLSICHLMGRQLITGLVKDGKPFEEYRLVVQYDFILTITAGANRPISFEKIQRFFFWLRDMCSFRFGLITADFFQSEMPLQMLENRGFKTGKLSVDKSKAPYYAWRSGFEENRIRMYRNKTLMREAEALVDGADKVDHPKDGSKDTADSACGAFWNATNSKSISGDLDTMSQPVYLHDGSVDDEERPPVDIRYTHPPRETRMFYA